MSLLRIAQPFRLLAQAYPSKTRARYSEGVSPVSFLKAVQKLLSLVKPTVKQMFFTESSVLWSRNLALLIDGERSPSPF